MHLVRLKNARRIKFKNMNIVTLELLQLQEW